MLVVLLLVLLVPPAIANSGAYVGFAGDVVALYRGSPDGFLWADAELDRRTSINRRDVAPGRVAELEDGYDFDSVGGANELVRTLGEEADEIHAERHVGRRPPRSSENDKREAEEERKRKADAHAQLDESSRT